MKTNIEKLRKARGITQEQLGNEVEVTRQTIIALEAGRYNPSLQLAHKITKALNAEKIEDVFKVEE